MLLRFIFLIMGVGMSFSEESIEKQIVGEWYGDYSKDLRKSSKYIFDPPRQSGDNTGRLVITSYRKDGELKRKVVAYFTYKIGKAIKSEGFDGDAHEIDFYFSEAKIYKDEKGAPPDEIEYYKNGESGTYGVILIESKNRIYITHRDSDVGKSPETRNTHIDKGLFVHEFIRLGSGLPYLYPDELEKRKRLDAQKNKERDEENKARLKETEIKDLEIIQKLGFSPITKEKYLELMKGQSFSSIKWYARNKWAVYEGNLELTPEQVQLLPNYSYIITGNLKVNGELDFRRVACLFVLGDVTASNIFLADGPTYFAGNTYFGDVLAIHGGSGAEIEIVSPVGLYIYNDADSAYLKVSPAKAKVYQDLAGEYMDDESFGNPSDYFAEEFLEKYDDSDIFTVNTYAISNAIKSGKKYRK